MKMSSGYGHAKNAMHAQIKETLQDAKRNESFERYRTIMSCEVIRFINGSSKSAKWLNPKFKVGFIAVFMLVIFSMQIAKSDAQIHVTYPTFTIPLSMPQRGTTMGFMRQHFAPFSSGQSQRVTSFMPQMGGRVISLPSMSSVSETLGALGTLARRFLRGNGVEAESKAEDDQVIPTSPSYFMPAASMHHSVNVTSPVFKVRPEEDPELTKALYTLSKNVLGSNVTESLVPIVKGVNSMGRFLPPLIYRDGRIILGTGNATKDGGNIKDVVCTTPGGRTGKCLDISGCPSLLLDLQRLRKSLCFKALFVPGVCCPDKPEMEDVITIPAKEQGNQVIVTNRPTTTDYDSGTTAGRPPPVSIPSKPGGTESSLAREDRCGRPETPSFRIVGGEKSKAGDWPWMAAIFLHGPKGTEFWCGGTLISKRYVLTAAHCTKDQKQKSFSPRQFTVRLGDYDLTRTDDPSAPESFRVVRIRAHESFNGVGFYNDVALLELDRDVDYNRWISPICLPQGRSKLNTFVGTFPTVIGWGTNKYGGREHTALQEVKLPVWNNQECDRAYFQPITEIFLCAGYRQGGRDACQGDSGGPLMLDIDGKWTQIGIVSFGNRCAEPGYPGVYTRLTQFMDWIQSNAI